MVRMRSASDCAGLMRIFSECCHREKSRRVNARSFSFTLLWHHRGGGGTGLRCGGGGGGVRPPGEKIKRPSHKRCPSYCRGGGWCWGRLAESVYGEKVCGGRARNNAAVAAGARWWRRLISQVSNRSGKTFHSSTTSPLHFAYTHRPWISAAETWLRTGWSFCLSQFIRSELIIRFFLHTYPYAMNNVILYDVSVILLTS